MSELLDRIDRAVDGLCQCGADPAPGSAYCGDDCTPTHRSVHTTSDTDGTQMRWRPDLVTEHDDSRLTLSTQFRRGPYNATMYEITNSGGVHCRLDDGNRFVGLDADGYQFTSEQGLEPVWQRLERELDDRRQLDPDVDPWADVMPSRRMSPRLQPASTGWARRCVHCGHRAVPRDTITPAPAPLIAWTADCGIPGQPGDVIANVEHGHDCGHCGQRFPGPALLVMRSDHREADLTVYRMVIGDRKAGLRVFDEDLTRRRDPEEWLERRLERLESELLMAYARANPDRPDVVEWAEACSSAYRREEQRYLQMVGPLILDPQAARSLFQDLNLT